MSDSKNKKAIKQHDFTKGDILKPIILFSLPVLFGDIFSALYNVVDSVVVGQFVGSGALAAVNSSFAITMVCVAIYSGFGMGSSVVAGQLFGAKDFNNLNKAISTAYIGAFFHRNHHVCCGNRNQYTTTQSYQYTGRNYARRGYLSENLLLRMHDTANVLHDLWYHARAG